MYTRQNMTDIAAAAVLLAAKHPTYDHDDIAIYAVRSFVELRAASSEPTTDAIVEATSEHLAKMEIQMGVLTIASKALGKDGPGDLKWDAPLDPANGVDGEKLEDIRGGIRQMLMDRFQFTLRALRTDPFTITEKSTVRTIADDVLVLSRLAPTAA